jgi:hypothetical protein
MDFSIVVMHCRVPGGRRLNLGFRARAAGAPRVMAKAVEWAMWWALLVGVWLTTLSSMDLLVAAVVAVPCALVGTLMRRAYRIPVRKAIKTVMVSAWPTSVVLDDPDDTLLMHPLRCGK